MDQSGKTGGSLVCVFKLSSDQLVYQGSMSVFKDGVTSKNIDEATMTFVQVPDSSGGSSPQVFTIGLNGQSYEGSLLPQGDYFPGLYPNYFSMKPIDGFTVNSNSVSLLLSASIGGDKSGERVYYAVTADPTSSSSSNKSAQYTVYKYDEKNKATQNVLLPVAKGSSIIALAIDADTGSVLTYEGVFHNDPPKGGSTKIDIKIINKTIKLYRIEDGGDPSTLNYLTPITINPVEGEDPVNVYNG